jgi:hypothetical protein
MIRSTLSAALEPQMEYVGIMLTVILVLVGVIFGLLLGLNYKVDKFQKAVDEMKRLIEK